MKFTVLDNNILEDEDADYKEAVVLSTTSDSYFKSRAIKIVQDYYELDNYARQYGDPVKDLMKYMTTGQITKVLKNLNYTVMVDK